MHNPNKGNTHRGKGSIPKGPSSVIYITDKSAYSPMMVLEYTYYIITMGISRTFYKIVSLTMWENGFSRLQKCACKSWTSLGLVHLQELRRGDLAVAIIIIKFMTFYLVPTKFVILHCSLQ